MSGPLGCKLAISPLPLERQWTVNRVKRGGKTMSQEFLRHKICSDHLVTIQDKA